MAGTVVIKWGGGLITYKDKLCTVNQTVIDALADVSALTVHVKRNLVLTCVRSNLASSHLYLARTDGQPSRCFGLEFHHRCRIKDNMKKNYYYNNHCNSMLLY